MVRGPSPAGDSRSYGKAWKVLEHGTRIYRPSATKPHWRVVVFEPGGRRSDRTANDEAEALEIARKAEAYLAARVSPTTGRTVADAAQSYLEHLATLGRAERYQERQRNNVSTWIVPIIGHLPLEDWTPYESEQVLGAMRAAGRKPATVQPVGSTLRGIVTHLHRRRWLPRTEDPMEDVAYSVASTEEGESADFVPPEEIPGAAAAEDLAVAMEKLYGPRWGVFTRLAVQGGPRWGETIALRALDVSVPPDKRLVMIAGTICQPEAGPMYRKETKNRKRRATIYYASLADSLAALVADVSESDGPEGLLFSSPEDGGYLSRQWFRHNMLLPAAREAGWEFVQPRTPRHSWHSLRHLAATEMLDTLGIPIKIVSRLLGHSDPAFTMRKYLGMDKGALDQAMAVTEDV